MLRALVLKLAENPVLRRSAERSRFLAPLTRRFVAGLALEEALAVCQRLNHSGYLVSLDHLGELVTSEIEAKMAVEDYHAALAAIHSGSLAATVSVKLTQFGLNISPALCEANVRTLMLAAVANHGFVEFDMEAHPYVDATLRIVKQMHSEFGCLRVALQAYLYRSVRDAEDLCDRKIPIRLCKGAYREPPEVAWPSKAQVNRSFMRLTELLMSRGVSPGIATHDPRMLRHAIRCASERGLSPASFEFQMLYGVRRDLQSWLLNQGYRVRIYVPYGKAWYPYLMRRIAERPANLFFVLRSLLRK